MGTDFHEWSSTSFFQIRPSVSLVLRQRAPRHTNRILLPRALVSWNFRTESVFIGMFPSPTNIRRAKNRCYNSQTKNAMKKQIVTILLLISMLSCSPYRDDGPELYERKPLKPGEIDPALSGCMRIDGKPIKRPSHTPPSSSSWPPLTAWPHGECPAPLGPRVPGAGICRPPTEVVQCRELLLNKPSFLRLSFLS